MSERTHVDGFSLDEFLLLYFFSNDISYKLMPQATGMKLEKIKSIMRAMRKRFKVHSVVALYRIALEWSGIPILPNTLHSATPFPEWGRFI